ncbi:MAG: hypothetical protein J5523_04690, partial [Muribaculaceae bacterium]|nr:hypothetical protein [Muribaculaceae bacterium]
ALLVITAGIQILLDNHSLLIVRKTLYFLTFHPKISLIFSQPISGQDRKDESNGKCGKDGKDGKNGKNVNLLISRRLIETRVDESGMIGITKVV